MTIGYPDESIYLKLEDKLWFDNCILKNGDFDPIKTFVTYLNKPKYNITESFLILTVNNGSYKLQKYL